MKNGTEQREQEFRDIYASFSEKIRRYLARLVGEDDSEDVTQEVFLKVNAALGNFRGESGLSTWIYRIATNAAMDHLRKSQADVTVQTTDQDAAVETAREEEIDADMSAPPLDSQLIRKEMNDCIRDVVNRLPENYRTVLVLGDLQELTNQEIADILDISLETVKVRLHRARAKLKQELECHCTFYRDERNEIACDRKTPQMVHLKR